MLRCICYCSATLLSLYLNIIIKNIKKRQKSSLQLGFAAWILWVVSLLSLYTQVSVSHPKGNFGEWSDSPQSLTISNISSVEIVILQTKSQNIQFRRNGRRLSLSQFWIFSSTSSYHFSTSFSCSFASLLFESACSVWLPRKLLKLNQCFFFLN